jgi:spore maturation protein SpmA/spore maturation protein SpmB
MLLTYLWVALITLAVLVATIKFIFLSHYTIYTEMVAALFDMSKDAYQIALGLTGVITLWMGLMLIAEKSGLIEKLSVLISPLFTKLFPQIPKNHPVIGSMMLNFSANMLGLDNAATPLGLKAMQGLQDLNENKEVATNSQIMFLVLNTSGLTLIPINIMLYRKELGAADPSDIFIPILITTFVSTLVGAIAVALKQRIQLFTTGFFIFLAVLALMVTLAVLGFQHITSDALGFGSSLLGNVLLLAVILLFVWSGMLKKLNVFELFLEGAKDGFFIAVKIIPYLVGLLSAIAMFKASGAFDLMIQGIAYISTADGHFIDVVKGLPTAIMKPLSGSGARAMMIDAMKSYGADSFTGRLVCIFQGSVDTTLYVVAVYFGSVGVKYSRYAIGYGMIADVASVIAAITVTYLFFG